MPYLSLKWQPEAKNPKLKPNMPNLSQKWLTGIKMPNLNQKWSLLIVERCWGRNENCEAFKRGAVTYLGEKWRA